MTSLQTSATLLLFLSILLATWVLMGAPLPPVVIGRRRIRCPHLEVRCVHGDEILRSGHASRYCYGCNRYLNGPHLIPCVPTEKVARMIWEAEDKGHSDDR